jgi:hypothetical protein
VIGALWLIACSGNIEGARGNEPAARGDRDSGVPSQGAAGSATGSGTGGASGANAAPFVAARSEARRLSRAELDNTLRDLLGDDTHPAVRLLPEDLFAPFDNDYTTQTVSGALIDSLEGLAADVAARVAGDRALRDRLVPCTPAGPGDEACFRQVVTRFLPRAFRRPVTSDEVDAYLALLDFATEDNPDVAHDFYTAVQLLVRAVLQDPEFLYRIETGEDSGDGRVFALGEREIAARMSYLLWGSAPDAALIDDAEAGRLSDSDSRRTIARRMLDDDRARDQLYRFHAMWLGYRAIPHPLALTSAFHRETTALLDRVVFDEPQSYLNLFTFPETRLDATLAEHYGLSAPASGEGWVEYGDSGRAGILSHGSVLSAFSKFVDTSPTQRGIFVRTRLLCQEIPRPPADVNADEPPGDQDAVCKYDRYSDHRSNGSCASCHEQMDPIGFGLENFDVAGRYRAHDDGLPQCAIAGEGAIVGHGEFSGPGELGALIVERGLVQPCIVRQFVQFALGRAPEGSEFQAVRALTAEFADSDHDFTELLVSYVAADAFALRMEPEVP